MYPSVEHPTFGIFVKNQVELLRAANVDVDVIAIDNPQKGKVVTIKKYATWLIKSFFYMLKNRKKLTLTHAHYAFPTGLLSLIGKKYFGIPYVVTVHGGDIDKMAAKSSRIEKLTTKILLDARTVIVVGEKLKTDVVERFGVPAERVEVMSMGVDTSVFKPVAMDVTRNALGLGGNERVILFVGNVIKAKGLVDLVNAYKILKEKHDCSLYIIGSQRDQSFMEELRSLIQREELTNIHFKDPLGQKELAQWMGASDILVLPSHHEGFGLVALEAMASGAKVVGSDVGGLSYLLGGHAGILVEPENPQSLAKGLAAAFETDNVAIQDDVVQARVTSNSFETILENLLVIYRKLDKD